MSILETISNDREKTRKDYIEALSKGQITQEMCTQLLLNYDTQYIALGDKLCYNDITKYYDLTQKCLEAFSKPKSFMESLGSGAKTFVREIEASRPSQKPVTETSATPTN